MGLQYVGLLAVACLCCGTAHALSPPPPVLTITPVPSTPILIEQAFAAVPGEGTVHVSFGGFAPMRASLVGAGPMSVSPGVFDVAFGRPQTVTIRCNASAPGSYSATLRLEFYGSVFEYPVTCTAGRGVGVASAVPVTTPVSLALLAFGLLAGARHRSMRSDRVA